ncbi:hypothetical protein AB1N83_013358 [Pleurotus pulmonarius]
MQFRQVFPIILGLLYCIPVSCTPLGQTIESRQLLPAGLVNLNFTHIAGHLTPLTLVTNTANVDFDVAPIIPNLSLLVAISITSVTLSAGISGTEYLAFTHDFDTPLSVPLTGSVNSGTINDASLTQGALPTVFNAFPAQSLDILGASVSMEVTIITPPFTAPLLLPLTQSNVATTWSLF